MPHRLYSKYFRAEVVVQQNHVSLDSVHLLLELGSLSVHARDDVADVADDRGEDEDGDEELDHDEDVLEDGGWVWHVTHHKLCTRRRWLGVGRHPS